MKSTIFASPQTSPILKPDASPEGQVEWVTVLTGMGDPAPENPRITSGPTIESARARGAIPALPIHIHTNFHIQATLFIPATRSQGSQPHTGRIQFGVLRIFSSTFSRARNRATLMVCDWNFAVTPVSSVSGINAGAIRRGAFFS